MGHALIARKHARQELGRNNYVFYSKEMNDRSYRQMILEAQMRHAIEYGEFVLYYQPKLDLRTGKVISVEALIRWQNPELGMVPPDTFIPVAERTGLITSIGHWVLGAACRQAAAWSDAGIELPLMSVNLSAVELRQENITEQILATIAEAGLEPHQLELEITETALMQDVDASAALLKGLHGRGLHIAVDDFGTGYSSLNYLKRFSVDTLKIDRSFVRELAVNSDDGTVVAAIIAMAHRMGIRVVAEGVETEAQLGFLRSLQCDEVQGYLFAKPMPADQAEAWLRAASRKSPLPGILDGAVHELTSSNVVSIAGDRPATMKRMDG
jgi:EAL domain-containing protein (putative c-di-GMP-specific phosphodiesterase class I)